MSTKSKSSGYDKETIDWFRKQSRIHQITQSREYRLASKSCESQHISDDSLTYAEVELRTGEEILLAFLRGEQVLIDAPPGAGKTTQAIKQCGENNLSVTYLTARNDLKEQAEDIADNIGLKCKTLPSFFDDCPSANGNYGNKTKNKVKKLYKKKLKPAEIHNQMSLPCEENGNCPYREAWDFDPANFPLLIGSYEHAFAEQILQNRELIIDEFPKDRFEISIPDAPAIVSSYLSGKNSLPWNSFTDLIQNRNRAQVSVSDQRDISGAVAKVNGHSMAPILVKALLEGDDLHNGFEVWNPPGGDIKAVVYNKNNSAMSILETPNISESHSVVALDGTPIPDMWGILFDNLEYKQVLTDPEKEEYISEVQGYKIVQTSPHKKPYSSGNYVNEDEDSALFRAIYDKHGKKSVLISSKKAIANYDSGNYLQYVAKHANSGNVLSSQKFAQEDLGVITGSHHYGHPFVKRWAAYAGESAKEQRTSSGFDYGGFGNKIRDFMYNQTLQEVLRFGRTRQTRATVYVHTSVLPNWIPLENDPDDCNIYKWTTKEKGTIEALRDLGRASTSQIMDHRSVSYGSKKGLRNSLKKLFDAGLISKTDNGSKYIWEWDKDIRIPVHVELP